MFDDESEGLCVVEGGGYAQILSLGSQFCEFGSTMEVVLFFDDAGLKKNLVVSIMRGKD